MWLPFQEAYHTQKKFKTYLVKLFILSLYSTETYTSTMNVLQKVLFCWWDKDQSQLFIVIKIPTAQNSPHKFQSFWKLELGLDFIAAHYQTTVVNSETNRLSLPNIHWDFK